MHGDSFPLCISFDSKPLPLVEMKGNEHSLRSHRFTPHFTKQQQQQQYHNNSSIAE